MGLWHSAWPVCYKGWGDFLRIIKEQNEVWSGTSLNGIV